MLARSKGESKQYFGLHLGISQPPAPFPFLIQWLIMTAVQGHFEVKVIYFE